MQLYNIDRYTCSKGSVCRWLQSSHFRLRCAVRLGLHDTGENVLHVLSFLSTGVDSETTLQPRQVNTTQCVEKTRMGQLLLTFKQQPLLMNLLKSVALSRSNTRQNIRKTKTPHLDAQGLFCGIQPPQQDTNLPSMKHLHLHHAKQPSMPSNQVIDSSLTTKKCSASEALCVL